MWIKWKYNDHGAGGFKEIEIPDWATKEYKSIDDSVKSYLCEHTGLIPTHSERFMPGRIEWKHLRKPSKEAVTKKILELKEGIKWRRQEVKWLSELLKA
jgi:hypothetical protein